MSSSRLGTKAYTEQPLSALCYRLQAVHEPSQEIYIVVYLLNITKSTLSSLSFVELPKVKVKKPWSEEERKAVHKHLGNFMTERRVPGKEDCTQTIKAEKTLGQRSWKDVKNFVYNTIVTLNRRSATRKLKY